MNRISICTALVFILVLTSSPALLAKDGPSGQERLVLFNTTGSLSEDGASYKVAIHGWIFRPRLNSLWRKLFVKNYGKSLGFNEEEIAREIFQKRARNFVVDSQRVREISVRIGDKIHKLAPSRADGHIFGEIEIDESEIGALRDSRWIRFSIDALDVDGVSFEGRCQMPSVEGVSVISDIDDTIKITWVLEEEKKHRNTFLAQYSAVPGMASAYRKWQDEGAAFHYVSGSPWQLYSYIEEGIEATNFPHGSYHMRYMNVAKKLLGLMNDSHLENKIVINTELFTKYPGRKFVLVGDSTEFDPEVYGTMYRKYPEQVIRIFIRRVDGAQNTEERFSEAFRDVPRELWSVFSDPVELEAYSLNR